MPQDFHCWLTLLLKAWPLVHQARLLVMLFGPLHHATGEAWIIQLNVLSMFCHTDRRYLKVNLPSVLISRSIEFVVQYTNASERVLASPVTILHVTFLFQGPLIGASFAHLKTLAVASKIWPSWHSFCRRCTQQTAFTLAASMRLIGNWSGCLIKLSAL